MNISISNDYILSALKELCAIPSPTGMTSAAIDRCASRLEEAGLSPRRTQRGALIATFGPAGARTVFSAHVDTLGAMVTAVKGDGRLALCAIAGLYFPSVEGEYVTVHTRSGKTYRGTCLVVKPSMHVWGKGEMDKLERKAENMEIRLDELVEKREETLALGISPGDPISFDPRFEATPAGYIKSRFLDDKAGVVAILAALDALRRAGAAPARAAGVHIATHEETGGGVPGLPDDTVEFIAVDMGVVGGACSGSERKVSLCPLDSSGPYDRGLFHRHVALCEKLGLPHAIDVYPHYGSDGSQVARTGRDVRVGLIGPGVHASHHVERTHLEGIAATARLIAAILLGE